MGFFENTEEKKNTLWVERYRPTSLDTFIGNEHLKDQLSIYIESGDIQNLLFFGKPGIGKTTASKMIVNSIDCDSLYINASDENGVDIIRDKIKGFASTRGFSNMKIVILDECLDENTLVTVLRSGSETQLPIKELNDKDDLVKSWNINENRIEWRPFYLWDKGIQDTYEIKLENGEVVVCTANHKWYVYDGDNNIIVVKTHELENYKYILSP